MVGRENVFIFVTFMQVTDNDLE